MHSLGISGCCSARRCCPRRPRPRARRCGCLRHRTVEARERVIIHELFSPAIMGYYWPSMAHSGSARRRAGGLGGASQRDRDTSRAGVVPAARNDLPRGPRADCHVRGCAECDCGRGGRRRWLHSASSICPTRRPTMAALCAASVVLTLPHLVGTSLRRAACSSRLPRGSRCCARATTSARPA